MPNPWNNNPNPVHPGLVQPPPWDADQSPRNTWSQHIERWRRRKVESGSAMIVMVLDRSGSMSSTRAAAEEGFKEFIKGQAAVPGKCLVTIAQFDDVREIVCSGVAVQRAPSWRCEPRGSTALVDAMGDTVWETLRSVADGQSVPAKVYVVVITDGQENASRKWTTPNLAAMVGELRSLGWEFVFMGSNIDSWDTAREFGFAQGSVMDYAATPGGTVNSYAVASANVSTSRSTGSALADFTDEQRDAAADEAPVTPTP